MSKLPGGGLDGHRNCVGRRVADHREQQSQLCHRRAIGIVPLMRPERAGGHLTGYVRQANRACPSLLWPPLARLAPDAKIPDLYTR